MNPNNVSIGFSNRKLHNLRNRLLPILILVSYIIPFVTLLVVDLTKRFEYLVPIALAFLAFNLLGATLWIWYKYIRSFGFPSLQSCRKMLELDAIKASLYNQNEEKGKISGVVTGAPILASFFVFLWHRTGFALFLFPAVYSLSIAVKALIRRARPPAVLLLGGSTYDGTRLQLKLVSIFDAPLVMSGLFHKENATVSISGVLSDFNSIRTSDYSKWQEMIITVLQLSRIVIIDIRDITESVQFEITQATKLVDPKRVFFVGQGVESVPLDRCFGEAELLNELRMKYRPPKNHPLKNPPATGYEDKKNGYFRFTPPVGWSISKKPDLRTRVKFSHPISPAIYFSFIVKEAFSTDFAALVLQQEKTIKEIESELRVTCQMVITEFMERKTIATMAFFPSGEVILNRLFISDGLHFNITYAAPNKAGFDAHLNEVDQSLESIEVLNKTSESYSQKLERMTQQEIARELRLAELTAEHYNIEKANRIVEELLKKYPNNKEVRKMAKDLEKISNSAT